MLENMGSVALQVVILFVIIATGFVLTKCNVLNKERVKGLIDIVVYVVTPSNIIVSFQRELREDLLKQLLLSFLLAFIAFFLNCVLAKLLIRGRDKNKDCVIEFASAFPNAGYFGLPLQQALLGDIGVFYGAAYIGMFHCYIWTYGIKVLSPAKEKINIKKILLNAPIIGVLVGMALFLTQVKLPEVIYSPLNYFSKLNSVLPMLVIGFYLANTDVKATFTNGKIYLGAVLRLLICPAFALLLCLLFRVESTVGVSCLIACSAPSAAMTGMLAMKYDRDTSVSAGMISLTTILCIITMPLMIALAQTVL